MEYEIMTLGVRGTNAILWAVVIWRIIGAKTPLLIGARKMVGAVVVVGMFMLVVGALVPFDYVRPEIARFIYTCYTAGTAVIAVTLLSLGREAHISDGRVEAPTSPDEPGP